MTKADWEKVKHALATSWGRVELRIDGYQVSIRRQRIEETRDCYAIYVDGWFRGEWLGKDCEERRRFMRPVKRHFYSRKRREEVQKLLKKEQRRPLLGEALRETLRKELEPFVYYVSYWLSVASMKRHLIAHNESIELLEPQE